MPDQSTFPLPGEVADAICRYSLKWHLDNMIEECNAHDDGTKPIDLHEYARNKELIPVFEKILAYYSI